MVKKLFALASVTALTGLTAAVAASGCSSTTKEEPAGDSGPAVDAKTPIIPKDSAEVDAPAGNCPSTTPITAADIDAQLAWKAPAAIQTVCNQKNIDDLKALFVKAGPTGTITYAEVETALGATCSACAFSEQTGANWQIFVKVPNGAIDNRVGSCMAQLENAACGKARFQWDECLDFTCQEAECGDEAKVKACKTKTQSGACKDLTTAYAKACPNEDTQLPICGNIFSAIAISCSGGKDASIDASTK